MQKNIKSWVEIAIESRESNYGCPIPAPSLLHNKNGTRDGGILPPLIRWLYHLWDKDKREKELAMRERERERVRERAVSLGDVFKLQIASMSLSNWQSLFLITN